MSATKLPTQTIGSDHAPAVSELPGAKVEFRAATLGEIRAIDLTAETPVLSAHILMTRSEFRRALAPFPLGRRRRHQVPRRPPGSLIWAQRATPSGDMIVGGRDANGFPSFPIPTPSGEILFASGFAASNGTHISTPEFAEAPVTWLERVAFEADTCAPIIASDDSITCYSSNCAACLQVIARNSWTTSIACACGR